MMKTGGILLPLALSGLIGLTLSGCAGQDKDNSPAAKAAADPKVALAGSVAALKDGNFSFTAKAPDAQGTGVVHLPSKSATVDYGSTGEDGEARFQVRLVGSDRWAKITVAGLDFGAEAAGSDPNDPQVKGLKALADMFSGKYWLHFDASKIKGEAGKDLDIDLADPDVTGISDVVAAVTTAQGDAHAITGTVDGTKIAGDDGFLSADDIKAAGPAVSSLPFTAAVDDQGRLTSFEVDMPKSGETPAGKWSVQISGYGEQKAQEKPAGAVQEMPAQVYSGLNS
jgi:hypothetical protein